MVFEVLSEGTEAVDRGEKLYNYRRLETLESYVLVSQEHRRVEVYRRQGSTDRWSYEVLEGAGAALTLPGPPITLSLDQIYEGIDLPVVR